MPVALPGDVLCLPAASSSSAIRLGPGLVYPSAEAKEAASSPSSSRRQLLVTRGGLVGKIDEKSKGKERERGGNPGRQGWWIEGSGKRYLPSPSDPIIAQITNRNADLYTLSLHTFQQATLPVLSFEGATKRNRPNLKVGTLIYGLITPSSFEGGNSMMEPEVTCVDPTTGKSDGMGELDAKEGYSGVIEGLSLSLVKSLLRPSHPLLGYLANHFPFESAIGMNGIVWIRVSHPSHFLAARLVLLEADRLGSAGVVELQEEEGKCGDWGRKLSTGWGKLEESEVGRIIKSVIA